MIARWVDPNIRSSVAVGVLLLCIAGLILTARSPLRPDSTSPLSVGGPLLTFGSDPDPDRDSSDTRAHFDQHALRGRLALSHGSLLASGTRQLFAELSVTASREVATARAPVSFVLVVDTSGSMAGRKLVDARDAALRLLDQMHDDDQVAVVRFAAQANVVVPLTFVGEGRARARGQVERMQAGGSTDIAGALRAAANQLASSGQRSSRIVLVTDGRDTSGAPRRTASFVAESESRRGVTVSALGIGSDYDDAYLGDLADAGRGHYSFLRDTSALSEFVTKELEETAHTTVRRIVAELRIPDGARIRRVSGATWTRGGEHATLTLGALHAGDSRNVVVELEVETGHAGGAVPFDTRLSWERVGDRAVEIDLPTLRVAVVSDPITVERSRDHSVLASVASLDASELELRAAQAFEQGDRERALQLNRESRQRVATAAQRAPAPLAARLRRQESAYQADEHTYRTVPKPKAAPAARAIGGRERHNMDWATGAGF